MGLRWDSVLKLGAFGVIIIIILQITFFFILQNIGYASYLLNISLIIFIFIFIVLLIAGRFVTKKLSYFSRVTYYVNLSIWFLKFNHRYYIMSYN